MCAAATFGRGREQAAYHLGEHVRYRRQKLPGSYGSQYSVLVMEQDLGVAEAMLNQKRSGRSKRRVGYAILVRHAQDDGQAAVSVPSFINGLAQLADGVE